MAYRHMKRSSILLIFREMQIEATMRYHLTPVRMAMIKKCAKNKSWKTLWSFLRKLKTELPYDLAILLLGRYLDTAIIRKDTHTPE